MTTQNSNHASVGEISDKRHSASKNWGNVRKDPMKGIRVGEPGANRNAVRVLISGSEVETLACIRRHSENAAWLKLADEIEFAKIKPRTAVLSLIKALREKRAERGGE